MWLAGSIAWLLALLLFACRWTSPTGFFQRWNVWDCGALFTRSAQVWGDVAVLVREQERAPWVQVDLTRISPQGLAGHRQRIDRVIEETVRRRKRLNLFPRVCEDIARKHFETGGGEVTEMRIVKTNWRAGTPPMAKPVGHWNPPPVAVVPASQIVTLHQARLVDGVWKETKLTDPAARPVLAQRGRPQMMAPASRKVRIVRPPEGEQARKAVGGGK